MHRNGWALYFSYRHCNLDRRSASCQVTYNGVSFIYALMKTCNEMNLNIILIETRKPWVIILDT